jgi:general secretion pathway protein D
MPPCHPEVRLKFVTRAATSTRPQRRVAVFLSIVLLPSLSLRAQTTAPTSAPSASTQPAGDQLITLDFPADGVEVRTLADIVSRRLNVPILYDESINNKKVILRIPGRVPESALMGLLQSALRMKQLALVDADQPGWKQIVASQNLAAVSRAPEPTAAGATTAPSTQPAAAAVTQVFSLRRADPARVVEAIRPMLTQPGGNAQPVPGQKLLIISDYAVVVQNIGRMIETIDSDGPGMQVRFVPLHEAEAATVTQLVTSLLASREAFLFGGNTPGVFLAADERSNAVIVVAPAERMKEVTDLISGMDRPVELTTRVYRLRAISPERVDRLVKDLLGNAGKRIYQSSMDRDSQSLVVSATQTVHERIATLLKDLDVPATAEQSPIRFYKLKNTKAADVLATIGSLLGNEQGGGGPNGQGATTPDQGASSTTTVGGGTLTTTQQSAPAVPGQPQSPQPTQANATAPANAASRMPAQSAGVVTSTGTTATGTTATGSTSGVNVFTPGGSNSGQFVQPFGNNNNGFTTTGGLSNGGLSSGGTGQNVQGVRTVNATVTADVNSNSIIVIAPPSVQATYAQLIQQLDERRPQVQIECTMVTLDTSNGWSVGVDIGTNGGVKSSQIISFGSFGVSKLNPVTGGLTPVDAPGGTFALLSPDNVDVVLHALANSSHARLISAPQLLVNDNNRGQLHSVAVEPFAEILTNATQSITGSGGEAQAGTTIQVEPHISQDDYLQLDYSIELSAFTGAARQGLPPPRQENQVASSVTIPDGYTIVVGGLSVRNNREATDSVPIIGDIPIIGWLVGTRSASRTDTTLFVFIRPTVLRDDKFQDLKYLSERKLRAASLPGDFPESAPIPLH